MAVVFLLGPSEWDPARAPHPTLTPLEIRRQIASTISAVRHHVIILEDVSDVAGEDLVEKFDRVLTGSGTTDVIVRWPPGAKMQTTFDELLLLRDRVERGLPRIWLLHQNGVASVDAGELIIKEQGGRSRYLTALGKLRIIPVEWDDLRDLDLQAEFLAGELS